MKIKAKSLIIAMTLFVLIGTISIILGINSFAALVLCLYIVIILYCSNNLGKHIVLLLFSASFFVFLVGGIIVKEYFGYTMSYEYSDGDYNYMLLAIFFSLLNVFFGYILFDRIKIHTSDKKKDSYSNNEYLEKYIRTISLYSQYIFLVAYILVLAESIVVVIRFGYYEYYSYESNLPSIVTELSDLYIVALFLFLGTLPEKKKAKTPLLIFFVLNCVSLMTGRRIYFVVDNLLIICYLLFRNKLTPEDKWITKKHVYLLIALIPFILVFLYSYNSIRFGRSSNAQSFGEGFLLFFKQQGFSANLIPLGKIYSDQLRDELYSFYDIFRTIRLNPIIRILTNSAYKYMYTGSREHLALYSGSFARAISYAVVKARYLYGYGMGSCYIAELYHDFDFWGIIIGNLLYGATIASINGLHESNIMKNMIILIMIRGFFKAPRYCFDSPYYVLLDFEIWLFIGFVYLIANMITKRNLVSHK